MEGESSRVQKPGLKRIVESGKFEWPTALGLAIVTGEADGGDGGGALCIQGLNLYGSAGGGGGATTVTLGQTAYQAAGGNGAATEVASLTASWQGAHTTSGAGTVTIAGGERSCSQVPAGRCRTVGMAAAGFQKKISSSNLRTCRLCRYWSMDPSKILLLAREYADAVAVRVAQS